MSDLYTPFVNKDCTICEIHRQIYLLIKGTEVEHKVLPLLEKAYACGKKMNTKLRQYKNNYDDNWYEKNKNFETLAGSVS